jgi:pSer/pThr/pTyr-binding forkhead associated (FHA) protein
MPDSSHPGSIRRSPPTTLGIPIPTQGKSSRVSPTPLPFAAQTSDEAGFVLVMEHELETQLILLKTVIHTLGRASDNTTRIQDRYLSRHHAYLVRVPHRASYTYCLFDGSRVDNTPSRNGVFVDDCQVKSRILNVGDIIYLGPNVRLTFQRLKPIRP